MHSLFLLGFCIALVSAQGPAVPNFPPGGNGAPEASNSCPSIHVLPDVTARPPSCTQGPNPSGTVCHFSCGPGFRVKGPSVTVCHDDGSWLFGHRSISCVDRNECRFRKGGCSHKCVNTIGGYHCECPDPLVLDKDNRTCRAVGLVLNCTDHDIKITIPKYALSDLQGDYLQLRDPTCHAYENKTHYIFKTPLTGCGTTRRHTKNFIVYSNKVSEKAVAHRGLITRIGDGEFNIPFCCYYLNNGIVSSVGYKPFVKELVIKEKAYGRFKLRMDFFHDANYQSAYTWGDFPVSVYLRERLYFEVSIDSHDPNLIVFAGNCCSTATRDHDKAGRFRYEIIHEGCLVDSTARMEQSSNPHKQRFSVEAFKFVGKFPFVYLHCSVIVCKADDHHSRCSEGCVPGLNRGKPYPQVHDVTTKDHVIAEPANQKADKDAPIRSTRAAVKSHQHKEERKYLLSKGPISLIEKEPAIQREQVPAAAAKEDAPSDRKQKRAENKSKTPQAGEKASNLGSRTATNVLLIVLTACTIFALVGMLYLGRKIQKEKARGQSGKAPDKS